MASDKNIYSTGPITYLFGQMSRLRGFREEKSELFDSLTDREIEVLALIAEGLNNPTISKTLGISRVTVQNHRARLRGKLNITNQTDYIKYALAFDLIRL